MRRQSPIARGRDEHTTRFAWWASFFATLLLIAALGIARSAQAAPAPLATASVIEEVDEEEGGEDEEAGDDQECEDGEEECEGEDEVESPRECLLNSARAKIFAATARDTVRLTVRYSTSSPTPVAVDYGLHGNKGSLYLGGDSRPPASHGVVQLTRTLSEAQMAKVLAAKDFTMRLRLSDAPSYCRPFFDRRLDVRRATPSGLSWSQAE